MSDKTRTATVYLQIRQGAPGGRWSPSTATAMASTSTYPKVTKPGCVVVKLRIAVPQEAWLPIAAAEVSVPIEQVVIEVEPASAIQEEEL